jgi:hypothetical protein
MELSMLADKYLGHHGGVDFLSAGSFACRVHEVTRSETATTPLIASVFWQAFLASPAAVRALELAGASPLALTRGEAFIIRHGANWPRHDLIILDPEFNLSEPGIAKAEATNNELAEGWDRFRSSRRAFSPQLETLIRRAGLDSVLAVEASNVQSFGVIVMRPPKLEFTHCPLPAWEVVAQPGGIRSTAGVIAKDISGRIGLTVALHAVPISANRVTVNGMLGSLVSRDAVSDSCFIEVQTCPIPPARGLSGPLSGITPRAYEQVSFEGVASGMVSTIVTGWSPDLPFTQPYSQLKVLTKPDTNPGDSGAALIDGTDHILGFSFYRTGFNASVEFSSWIWAESVFEAHGLSMI